MGLSFPDSKYVRIQVCNRSDNVTFDYYFDCFSWENVFCRYIYVRPLFNSFLWHVKRCNIRYLNTCIINFPNFVFDISLFVFNVDSLVFKNSISIQSNIVFSALYYSQFCTFLLCVSDFFHVVII